MENEEEKKKCIKEEYSTATKAWQSHMSLRIGNAAASPYRLILPSSTVYRMQQGFRSKIKKTGKEDIKVVKGQEEKGIEGLY